MDMPYKRGIGSQLMPRDTFVQQVHRVRETHGHLVLPSDEPAQNCKEVIDRNQPQPQQPQQKQKKQKDPKQKQLVAKDHSHTENDAPTNKRVRKSDSEGD